VKATSPKAPFFQKAEKRMRADDPHCLMEGSRFLMPFFFFFFKKNHISKLTDERQGFSG